MTYCKTVRAELPFVIGFADPMDPWKLYRKYCAALFFKDKDPSIQGKTPAILIWLRPCKTVWLKLEEQKLWTCDDVNCC